MVGENRSERPALLQERQKTHGSFASNARISQQLKHIFRRETNNIVVLTDIHNEAIVMIAVKLSRILSGSANFKDHWDDIAGYAQLAAEACKQ